VQTPTRTLRGRFEPNTGMLWIVTKNFRDWAINEARVGYNETIDKLIAKHTGCKAEVQKRLDANTNLTPTRVRCVEFPNGSDFFDAVMQDDGDSNAV